MKKAWIVARYEFSATVKRVWFWAFTLFPPLLYAGVGGGLSFQARRAVESSEQEVTRKPVGVVDDWGRLKGEPAGFRTVRFFDETSAREALTKKEIGLYVAVPADYVKNGRVRTVAIRRPGTFAASRGPLPVQVYRGVEAWLVESLLEGVDAGRVERAKAPFAPEVVYLDPSGQPSRDDPLAAVRRSMVAFGFFLLIFLSIMTSTQYLVQWAAEEKENRVIEMVLSSVTPLELMTGKLVGLGAAGLLQLALWSAMGLTGVALFVAGITLEPAMFLFCLAYFLLGYTLYGSLMLGFGAVGTNARESFQMASIWSFLAMSPLFVVIELMESPHGAFARAFSMIPFTSPATMMFRYAIDPAGVPWSDIVLSVLGLLAATVVAVWASARVYRAALLMYGKRPRLREICRWLVAGR